MNKVLLVARLTKDPDIRYTDNGGTCIARFNVAVDRRFKKDGEATADFPNVVAFGKTAEFIEKYFHKGMKIGISGRLQTGSYTDKDGKTIYTTDVIAEEVEFVEKKDAEGDSKGGFENIPDGIMEDLPFMQPNR